jgi:hypothetical protein
MPASRVRTPAGLDRKIGLTIFEGPQAWRRGRERRRARCGDRAAEGRERRVAPTALAGATERGGAGHRPLMT